MTLDSGILFVGGPETCELSKEAKKLDEIFIGSDVIDNAAKRELDF